MRFVERANGYGVRAELEGVGITEPLLLRLGGPDRGHRVARPGRLFPLV